MDDDSSLQHQRLVFPIVHCPQPNSYYPNTVPPPVFPSQYYPSYPSSPFYYYYYRPHLPISTPSTNTPANLMLNHNELSQQQPQPPQSCYQQIDNQFNLQEDTVSQSANFEDYLPTHHLPLSPAKTIKEANEIDNLPFKSRKRRSGRRRYGSKLRRISFTPDQLNALGHEFTLNPYCPGKRGIAIASKINVSSKQVSTWFQNKRAKEKRVTLNNLNGSSALGDYDSSTSSSSNNPNITFSEEEGSNAAFNTQTSQAPFSSVTKI